MSLQGSFETIALPDVMALLAASSKSGELRVVGEHVEGRLWLQDGCLVASKVGKAQGHVDALFELMRLTEGNFVFKDGAEVPEPGEAVAIEPVVREAEERLKEWQDITQVVPSAEHRVRLIPDLPTAEVTLSADEWHLVMAIALAGTVQGVLEEVSLGQFDGFRGIRRLVDAGLVLVEPPRARPVAAAHRPARRSTPLSAAGLAVSPDPAAPPPVGPSPLAASLSAALAAVRQPPVAMAPPAPPEPPRLSALFQAAQEPEYGDNGYDYEDEGAVVHHFPLPTDDEPLPFAVVSGQSSPSPFPGPTFDPSTADALSGRRARRQAAAAREELARTAPVDSALQSSALQRSILQASALQASALQASALQASALQDNGHDDGGLGPEDSGHEGNGRPVNGHRDADGEAINRGLLLKFLSSVRS